METIPFDYPKFKKLEQVLDLLKEVHAAYMGSGEPQKQADEFALSLVQWYGEIDFDYVYVDLRITARIPEEDIEFVQKNLKDLEQRLNSHLSAWLEKFDIDTRELVFAVSHDACVKETMTLIRLEEATYRMGEPIGYQAAVNDFEVDSVDYFLTDKQIEKLDVILENEAQWTFSYVFAKKTKFGFQIETLDYDYFDVSNIKSPDKNFRRCLGEIFMVNNKMRLLSTADWQADSVAGVEDARAKAVGLAEQALKSVRA